MTEETDKMEDLKSMETEPKKLQDDGGFEEKDSKEDGITHSSDNVREPHSPSQSVESDSNLKTETTESNSVEFSQDLLTEEINDNTTDETDNKKRMGKPTSDRNNEPVDNNYSSEDTDTAQSHVIETDMSKNDENVLQEKQDEQEQSKELKVLLNNTGDKTVNGHQVKETKEREVIPKTTKETPKAKSRSGKMVFCKVHLLDGQLYETDVTKNATGKELFDKVCGYLTLQEKDYFGLQYTANNVKFWMNNEKKILKQVKGGTCVFDFSVKFYPPEPLSMLEDISRFQLCLQVRFDIFNGKLPCSFTTLAVLGSYMVQAEVGDFDNIDEYEFGPGDSYLDKIEYAPDKSAEMRSKVYELHRTHKGLTPEEAELQYLENAKKLAMYGVDLHQTRDSQGVKLMLGVCASGVQVYKDKLRINRFVWPAILKLSYKRNNFYVKKRPMEGEKDGETIGFKLENHKMAKRLWKTCVEHHAFFRLHESDPPKSSTFPRFNSRFRYSGRTQKQVRDEVEKVENRPKFDRTHFRYSSMPQANNTDGYNHGYPDEKDRTDHKGAVTPSTESGPPPYNQDGYRTNESSADKANSLGDSSEDRRDRTPGQGDAIEMLPLGGAGDAATLELQKKKTKEDKEREKREKEEEKRRKKEEEKERKRLEKERKHSKGGSSEDRTDKLGGDQATEGYNGDHVPGTAGLDSKEVVIKEERKVEQSSMSEMTEKIEPTILISAVTITQEGKKEASENNMNTNNEKEVSLGVTSASDKTVIVIQEEDKSTQVKVNGETTVNNTTETKVNEISVVKMEEGKCVESKDFVLDVKKKETTTQVDASTELETKIVEKDEPIIPDEIIEDNVFAQSEEKKYEHGAVCNHIGSETGSLSSDSSDDEDICGSYHVESPVDEIPPKTKVEAILEEQVEIDEIVKETESVKEEQIEVESNTDVVCNEHVNTNVEKMTEMVTEIKKDEINANIKNEEEISAAEVNPSSAQNENENHERKIEEKRDFDIVVSEQKSVSPDGNQIISLRSERRTETIQKEVVTHTRRELKPEEFAKYEKEIAAADQRNKIENKKQEISENLTEIESKEKISVQEINTETTKDLDEKTEDSVVEVKIVKSEKSLEENVEKMKYIDESSGDSVSEMIKTNLEVQDVVTTVVNEEAEKNVEIEVEKIDKRESMRLKKEESERKKKELAEEKERKKREQLEEKERIKRIKKEEKERLKKEKLEEKERLKKEKEAEKEKKRKEKENKKSKKNVTDEVAKPNIEEKGAQLDEKETVEKSKEKNESSTKDEVMEERVPTAIAMVMAKQKEEEKMEEINLNDEPVVEEMPKEEPKVDKKKKQKKSKKDNKENEPKMQKHKKHKTTGCFAFSASPSSDEDEMNAEEKPVEEVKEEVVKEEMKPVEEEVKVGPKQKGKGLGWALPGMEELQQKGTKHEDKQKRLNVTSDSQQSSKSSKDNEGKAPLAALTEIPRSELDGTDLTQTTNNEIQDLDHVADLSSKGHIEPVNYSSDDLEKSPESSSQQNEVAGKTESINITSSGENVVSDGPELIRNTYAMSNNSDLIQTRENIEIKASCTPKLEEVETETLDPPESIERTENVETDMSNTKEVIEKMENIEAEVGLGADGQMINRYIPEGEGSIDRRMQFIPVTPPIQETKDSLKHTMAFFDPAADAHGKKAPPPVPPKGMRNGFSEEDRLLQDMPPTIPTESFTYENNTDDIPISTKNVPYVKTKTQTVTYEKDGYPYETEDGILISSQSHSTRTQTIETTTYKTEKDGKIETRVEKKVVITDEGDDDDLDHDDLLAEAIRSVTEMNPDLSVERIECMRQIEEVEK